MSPRNWTPSPRHDPPPKTVTPRDDMPVPDGRDDGAVREGIPELSPLR